MNRIANILTAFEKVAAELPVPEPSNRIKNILQKAAICPAMMGMEPIGETGMEAEEPEEEQGGVQVVSMGDGDNPEKEEAEEEAIEDSIKAGFPAEKMASLTTLMDEYRIHLNKYAALDTAKGTEDDDNQGTEEVPTQIADNSAENAPPKGVSASCDETEERKKAEEAQSQEKNEKVATDRLGTIKTLTEKLAAACASKQNKAPKERTYTKVNTMEPVKQVKKP